MFKLIVLSLCVALASCIVKPQPKIAEGEIALSGEFPYAVTLNQINTNAHVCGGAILNKRWVLSSATCINRWGGAFNLQVHAGSVLVTAGTVYNIMGSIQHPDYDPFTVRYDLMLLHLATEIMFTEDVQPIIVNDTPVAENAKVVYMGWGSESMEDMVPSQFLRYLNATVIEEHECLLRHPSHNIHASQLCTMSPINQGACPMDEGNPVVLDGTLIGIQSFLLDCGTGVPDVHTRLAYPSVFEWIELNISA